MGPGFAAPERKIVSIGSLPARGLLGLDHLVGNALALTIGDRFFFGLEDDRELLLHVAGTGTYHQRLDCPWLLGLVLELPLLGLSHARLHRGLGGLKDARGHLIDLGKAECGRMV